jgi:hypothetical protein
MLSDEPLPISTDLDEVDRPRRRLGSYHPRQVLIWREMSGSRRLELACQAYRFALETVRFTERCRHPDLTREELDWRVIRRVHGDRPLRRAVEPRSDG